MYLKDGTSNRGQVVSTIGHFVTVMHVNGTQTCSEINCLTEFWFKIIIRMQEQCIPGLHFPSPQNTKALEQG